MTRREIKITQALKGIKLKKRDAIFVDKVNHIVLGPEPVRGLSDIEKRSLYGLVYKYREQVPEIYNDCKYDYRCRELRLIDQLKSKNVFKRKPKPMPEG